MKFAKYHAVRIVKAIKAGEDPNASNPKIEEEELEPAGDLSQGEPTDLDAAAPSSQIPMQPRVEDVPDEAQTAQSSNPPLTLPQPPTTFTDLPSAPEGPASTPGRTMDVGPDEDSPLNLPSAPNTFASETSPKLPDTPTNIGAHHQSKPSNEFQSFPPPSTMPPTNPAPAPAPHNVDSFYNVPSAGGPSHPVPPSGPGRGVPYQPPVATPPVAAPATYSQAPSHGLDDQAISLAQKHARWAVSALTFDDVNTAIKELRNSLKQLGAE